MRTTRMNKTENSHKAGRKYGSINEIAIPKSKIFKALYSSKTIEDAALLLNISPVSLQYRITHYINGTEIKTQAEVSLGYYQTNHIVDKNYNDNFGKSKWEIADETIGLCPYKYGRYAQ